VQELYTKLISDDKADFLISPYSSGLTDAAAVIAQQYNKIMITAGAASTPPIRKVTRWFIRPTRRPAAT